MWRPDRAAKWSRISFNLVAPISLAFSTIRVSSAYYSTAHGKPSSVGCLMSAQFLINPCKVSATRRNRYGDMGSPCLRPRLQVIHGLGQPFTSTTDLEEVSIEDIQLIHRSQKPLDCMTLNSLSQFTVSNAFAKSSFSTMAGLFLL